MKEEVEEGKKETLKVEVEEEEQGEMEGNENRKK